MARHADPPILHPFPQHCPSISIRERAESLAPIHSSELQWWFAIPRVGDRTMDASYDVDTGRLAFVRQVRSSRPATIDGQPCVELVIDEWAAADTTTTEHRFYCRIDAATVRWLGVALTTAAGTALTTVHDPSFAHNWGATGARWLVDDGRYQRQTERAYRMTDQAGRGAGVYEVTIGPRTFVCLRVLDVGAAADEDG